MSRIENLRRTNSTSSTCLSTANWAKLIADCCWPRSTRGPAHGAAGASVSRSADLADRGSRPRTRCRGFAFICSSGYRSFFQGQERAVVQPVATQRWWTTGSGVSLAMAACFLVAFSLAWMIRSPGFASVQDARVVGPAIAAVASADSPRVPGIASDAAGSAERWDTVTLVMDGGPNDQREISYPVIEGAGGDDRWLERTRACRFTGVARCARAIRASCRRAPAICAGRSAGWPAVDRAG